MTGAEELRTHPEHAWLAAALPANARRLRVHDETLAAMLRAAGADVTGTEPDVEIGRAGAIAGDAPLALVPIAALGTLLGPRPLRLARRLAAAGTVRARATVARRVLRRHGYPDVEVWPWDVEQAMRLPGPRPRPLRLVERVPRAALVIGRRADLGPSVLDAVAREAGSRIGLSLVPRWPHVTPSGALLVFSASHVLRVAAGPGRRNLERHRAALSELRALDPPAAVAERLPRAGPSGDLGLAGWLIEGRLRGTVPDEVGGELRKECVDFLVALHGCEGGDAGDGLAAGAEIVASRSSAPREQLVRLAGRLDDELRGLPRGFGHGDFWCKNLLVDGGRLVGVADWEESGPGRLPLLDLLQLTISQSPFAGRELGVTVVDSMLPWARAGADADGRRYCERVGFEPIPGVLRALVLAFWLDRLARELAKCGDKESTTPAWRATNIDPVLAALEAEER